MTYKLPKDINKWGNELKNRINKKMGFGYKNKGWGEDFDGRIVLHWENDENYDEELYIRIHSVNGECNAITPHRNEPNHYGFLYRGTMTDWAELLNSDHQESLTDGTFELEGDLETFVEYKHSHHLMASCAQNIKVEFESRRRGDGNE